MTETSDLKKMYWHSRRGMLELDLILVPFAENVLPTLEEDQKNEYARLLLEEDQDLLLWLVKKIPIPDESLQEMVDFILSQHSQINNN
jgi:antitoxin CptB